MARRPDIRKRAFVPAPYCVLRDRLNFIRLQTSDNSSLPDFEIHGLGSNSEFLFGQFIGNDDLQRVITGGGMRQLHSTSSHQMPGILLALAVHRSRRTGINLLSVAKQPRLDFQLELLVVVGMGVKI